MLEAGSSILESVTLNGSTARRPLEQASSEESPTDLGFYAGSRRTLFLAVEPFDLDAIPKVLEFGVAGNQGCAGAVGEGRGEGVCV
jgi:hypothetical protein